MNPADLIYHPEVSTDDSSDQFQSEAAANEPEALTENDPIPTTEGEYATEETQQGGGTPDTTTLNTMIKGVFKEVMNEESEEDKPDATPTEEQESFKSTSSKKEVHSNEPIQSKNTTTTKHGYEEMFGNRLLDNFNSMDYVRNDILLREFQDHKNRLYALLSDENYKAAPGNRMTVKQVDTMAIEQAVKKLHHEYGGDYNPKDIVSRIKEAQGRKAVEAKMQEEERENKKKATSNATKKWIPPLPPAKKGKKKPTSDLSLKSIAERAKNMKKGEKSTQKEAFTPGDFQKGWDKHNEENPSDPDSDDQDAADNTSCAAQDAENILNEMSSSPEVLETPSKKDKTTSKPPFRSSIKPSGKGKEKVKEDVDPEYISGSSIEEDEDTPNEGEGAESDENEEADEVDQPEEIEEPVVKEEKKKPKKRRTGPPVTPKQIASAAHAPKRQSKKLQDYIHRSIVDFHWKAPTKWKGKWTPENNELDTIARNLRGLYMANENLFLLKSANAKDYQKVLESAWASYESNADEKLLNDTIIQLFSFDPFNNAWDVQNNYLADQLKIQSDIMAQNKAKKSSTTSGGKAAKEPKTPSSSIKRKRAPSPDDEDDEPASKAVKTSKAESKTMISYLKELKGSMEDRMFKLVDKQADGKEVIKYLRTLKEGIENKMISLLQDE